MQDKFQMVKTNYQMTSEMLDKLKQSELEMEQQISRLQDQN